MDLTLTIIMLRQCFNVYLNYFVIIIINGMTISVFHLCYVLLLVSSFHVKNRLEFVDVVT